MPKAVGKRGKVGGRAWLEHLKVNLGSTEVNSEGKLRRLNSVAERLCKTTPQQQFTEGRREGQECRWERLATSLG